MNLTVITELIENKWIKSILILYVIALMGCVGWTFPIIFIDMDQYSVLHVVIGDLGCLFN